MPPTGLHRYSTRGAKKHSGKTLIHKKKKIKNVATGLEMAQQLRVLATRPEDPSNQMWLTAVYSGILNALFEYACLHGDRTLTYIK